MELPDEIIINLSKNKIILIVLGSIIFVLAGLWLLTLDPEQLSKARRFNNPILVKAIAFSCIGFFGFCGIYGVAKLFDTKPGLILNSNGIIDNSSAVAVGQIPWYEIQGFNEYEISGQKMLVVLVNEPEKYIKQGNSIRRALIKANLKRVGSPITISANALKINYAKLTELCVGFHQRYRKDA